jgi:hypothetical protein
MNKIFSTLILASIAPWTAQADGGIKYFKKVAYPKNPLNRLELALREKFYGNTFTHPFHRERVRYLEHWKALHERGKR